MTTIAKALLASVASVALALPASAAVMIFTLSGNFDATWQMPKTPTPDSFVSFGFIVNNVTVTVNGTPRLTNLVFYSSTFNGGLCSSPDLQFCENDFIFIGDQVFSGTTLNPIFEPGQFALFSGASGGMKLSITEGAAVPEPASWAMLIAGFGLVGAVRRRRTATVVA